MKAGRLGRAIAVTALASSLIVTPVFAEPSVDELQQNKVAAEGAVNSMQEELTGILIEMDKLETELVTKGQEVIQATTDLQLAQEKEQDQYADMKLRIRYMYEEGDATFLVKILESQSITEALNKAEYVTKVHSYDRKKLEEFAKTKKEVVDLKTTLETEVGNLQTMQTSYESEKESLNGTIAAKQAEVSDFDVQIQAAAEAAAAAREKELEVQAQQAVAVANNDGGSKGAADNIDAAASSGGGSNSGGGNDDSQNIDTSDDSYNPPSGGSGGSAIVNAAYGFLGVPYVWGGQSPSGMDCSGLVLLTHKAIGVDLPRTSGPQGAGGQAVGGMSNALPGDVVCYSGHVGIYIGGGQMIHAPEPGDVVKVSNVWGSPWFRRYW